jgi:hypothetical protein
MFVEGLASVDDLSICFALPLLVEAFQEFQGVLIAARDSPWAYNVSPSNICLRTPARFYKFMFEQIPKDVALNFIWKSRSLTKLKFFCAY